MIELVSLSSCTLWIGTVSDELLSLPVTVHDVLLECDGIPSALVLGQFIDCAKVWQGCDQGRMLSRIVEVGSCTGRSRPDAALDEGRLGLNVKL